MQIFLNFSKNINYIFTYEDVVMYVFFFQTYLIFRLLATHLIDIFKKKYTSKFEILTTFFPCLKEIAWLFLLFGSTKIKTFQLFMFIAFLRFLVHMCMFITNDIKQEKINGLTFFISLLAIIFGITKIYVPQ